MAESLDQACGLGSRVGVQRFFSGRNLSDYLGQLLVEGIDVLVQTVENFDFQGLIPQID